MRARSIPRVGSSRATSPGSRPSAARPAITSASARRWRSPPDRSRGSASAAHPSPTDGEGLTARLAGQLVGDPLADQQVAWALGEKRAAPRRRDPPPGRLHQSRGRAQERGLAGAVATHQRHPLARLEHQVHAAQDIAGPAAIVELHPQVSERPASVAG